MTFRAPRLVRRLAGLVAPAEDRVWLLADLDEEAAAVARRDGPAAARRWYRRQVLASLAPLARRRLARAARARHPGGPEDGRAPMFDAWRLDIGQAVRAAARAPVASLVVVATLAIGIGATAAIASVLEAVLLRPLPFPDSGRIVRIDAVYRDDGPVPAVNYFDLRDVAAETSSFEVVAPYTITSMTWLADAGPERLRVARVGPDFDRVLATGLAAGRPFDREEHAPGADAVAIVGHRFWTRVFGEDPGVVGATVVLDGRRHEIVGALPRTAFEFPEADVWIPLAIAPDSFLYNRQAVALGGLGRVRGDRAVEEAAAEVAALSGRLAAAYPDTNAERGLRIVGLQETIAGPARPMLLLLAGLVGAVLLIASANIAGLAGARARRRQREFAVRAALGGGSRLGGQIFLETAVLAATGGGAGLLVAPALATLLAGLYPDGLPRAAEIVVDGRTILAALAATTTAALVAGLPLVRQVRRVDLARVLHDGGRSSAGRGERRARSALVVAQVAATVSLLWVGAVFLQTFWILVRTDPGFDVANVLTFQIAPAGPRYATEGAAARFYRDAIDALARLPGARRVGGTAALPLAPGTWGDGFRRVGIDDPSADPQPVTVQRVTPDLPATLGMRLVAGRPFAGTDGPNAPRVAMLSASAARRAYGDRSPIGRLIEFQDSAWEVVGVVADKRHRGPRTPPAPELYVPVAQMEPGALWIAIKTDGDAAALLPSARAVVARLDPTQALIRPATLEARLGGVLAPDRFRAALAGSLGAVALLLATLGLYGLVSAGVALRTREIGIRLALGERAGRLVGRVLAGAVRLALAGAALGGVGSAALTPWMRAWLPDGDVAGAGTFVAIAALMSLVALAAAWRPARRVSRVDPLTALRCE